MTEALEEQNQPNNNSHIRGYFAIIGTNDGSLTVNLLVDHYDELRGRVVESIVNSAHANPSQSTHTRKELVLSEHSPRTPA
jgi:hypothetical protein